MGLNGLGTRMCHKEPQSIWLGQTQDWELTCACTVCLNLNCPLLVQDYFVRSIFSLFKARYTNLFGNVDEVRIRYVIAQNKIDSLMQTIRDAVSSSIETAEEKLAQILEMLTGAKDDAAKKKDQYIAEAEKRKDQYADSASKQKEKIVKEAEKKSKEAQKEANKLKSEL